jgi:hypothetical protein
MSRGGRDPSREVVGWPLFALEGGRRVSPFQRDKVGRTLGADELRCGGVAECLQKRDKKPAASCTCGYRASEEFGEYMRLLLVLHFEEGGPTVLEECSVLAKVRLSGSLGAWRLRCPADDLACEPRRSERVSRRSARRTAEQHSHEQRRAQLSWLTDRSQGIGRSSQSPQITSPR